MPQYTPIRLTEDELLNHLPDKIGQVSLNYDYYPGKDMYSDGQIEDELLKIVNESSKVEYPDIIEKSGSWPILYHLSPIRGNIVDFLPITSKDRVLEIGSGCGAITEKLAQMAGEVTCVDLSAKRSMVNAGRNRDCENVKIYVGNFNDIEPHLDTDYDYVCLIGVFEYGSSYIPSDTPYEDFLKIIMKHCKKGGRVVIAIENKFGLKYWAGCKEDHNGELFSSLESYPNKGSARTFTRPGLEKIFKNCGVSEYHFYYPYPDYKLPSVIYSDKRLPMKGELTDNLRNFDRNRMLLFNESYVFDSVVEDDVFSLFSNSYLVVLGPDVDTSYVKYSNDRSFGKSIRTEIAGSMAEGGEKVTVAGEKIVRKVPLDYEAGSHLKKFAENYNKLCLRYEGSKLNINPCIFDEETKIASLKFEKGRSLEELLDERLFKGDIEGFKSLFRKYFELISYNSGKADITDYDMIFANILVEECDFGMTAANADAGVGTAAEDNSRWVVIDYEWCVDRIIDIREVAFRALYCYVLEDERRNAICMDDLLEIAGIAPNSVEDYILAEKQFQKGVTQNHRALGEIRATIGTYAIDAKKLFSEALQKILDKRIQVYYDDGTGFSENNSRYIPNVYTDECNISVDIPFDGNIRALRIDPADFRCIVKIKELLINGENVLKSKKTVLTNGKMLNYGTYIFNTEDPNINIQLNELEIRGENVLHAEMEIDPVSEQMALDISNSIKKLF